MKKILLILAMLFSLGLLAEEVPTSVKFEEGNFFSITSQFNQSLLDNFTEKVLGYDKPEMFLYFDTPGGSVVALSRMARIMKSSNIKFICVVNFAASAGFMLFQHCQRRLLLSDGLLMSHNWTGSFRGEAPRILTLFNAVQSLVNTLEAVVINKLNVDATEYAILINSNLWMPAILAIKYAAIDEVIDNVTCDKRLIEERIPTISKSYFGNKIVYRSGCPLIQKVYKKVSNKVGYLETGLTLFELAQKSYQFKEANWIYMGSKFLK